MLCSFPYLMYKLTLQLQLEKFQLHPNHEVGEKNRYSFPSVERYSIGSLI